MPADKNRSEFDLEHIAAVCDDAFNTIRAHTIPAEARTIRGMPAVPAPDEAHQLAALKALRRVGYSAFPLPPAPRHDLRNEPHDEPRQQPWDETVRWIRVRGWDLYALNRRLDELTATAHQLESDLPLNVGRAIDTYAISADQPDLDAPGYKAAIQLRAQLRDQVRQTTGPHVPYDPDLLPTNARHADLLKRVRAQEHRVDDLISRTWLLATDGVGHYRHFHVRYPPTLARDLALTKALKPTADLAQRDTIITAMQWAREQGHGDAIAYAHWYGATYRTFRHGPTPAVGYETWRTRMDPGPHPAAVAARDTPAADQAGPPALDTNDTENADRTAERHAVRQGRRPS